MTTLESLDEMRAYHETRISLLESIAGRQQSLLEEVRRDAANTQRLWIHLCRKYGWLEDADTWGGQQ